MELILFVGLQATGKTSFFRARFAATHVHVSKDNFPNARRPVERQVREIEAALGTGRSAVVDNTNPTRDDRLALITLARRYQAKVVGYYFRSDLDACLLRNAQREGKRRLPEVALYDTSKRLVLPSLEEGFDALFYVTLISGGEFEVSPWEADT